MLKEGNKIVEAIQTTWELTAENRERETAGLLEAMEKFDLKKGTILTNDREENITVSGKKLTIKPVWKWLLEK